MNTILESLVKIINHRDVTGEVQLELMAVASQVHKLIQETPTDQIIDEIETIREKNFDSEGNFIEYSPLEVFN